MLKFDVEVEPEMLRQQAVIWEELKSAIQNKQFDRLEAKKMELLKEFATYRKACIKNYKIWKKIRPPAKPYARKGDVMQELAAGMFYARKGAQKNRKFIYETGDDLLNNEDILTALFKYMEDIKLFRV